MDIQLPKPDREAGVTKLLESLKKHLLERSEQSGGKTRTTREVCASLSELTTNVCNRPGNQHFVSSTVELLVHAYANVDQSIRMSASENLRRLIKVLMGNHLHRLQQDLFHELKKNGTTRSLCLSLECFSALFPLTRPQKCQTLSQTLLPVLQRIVQRKEESIHENLIDSLPLILPTMTPFLISAQVQELMTSILKLFPTSSASFRRMAAVALSSLCVNCKQPHSRADWIISKLLGVATCGSVHQRVVQGVLLSLQQLLQHFDTLEPTCHLLKRVYSLAMSGVVYGDHNTTNAGLEVMEQLLQVPSPDFIIFLTSSPTSPNIVINYWPGEAVDTAEDELGDLESSQLEEPLDSHFSASVEEGKEQSMHNTSLSTSWSAGLSLGSSPTSSIDSWALSMASLPETHCMASSHSSSPLRDLVQFLLERILSHSRVSVQSLGLTCLAAAVHLEPTCLSNLTGVCEFASSEDPKLVSRTAWLLAKLIAAELRIASGQLAGCQRVTEACQLLGTILDSEVPVVLKAVCEALQACLPCLLACSHPKLALELLNKLLNLRNHSYWLLKVELLQTLSVLDYSLLAVEDPAILSKVLDQVVFPMLGDSDHRVRSAVSSTLTELAWKMDLSADGWLGHARQQTADLLRHMYTVPILLSLAGIGSADKKFTPTIPSSLSYIVWRCTTALAVAGNGLSQRGALEVLCTLADRYPPPTLPTLWGVSGSECGLLELLLQLLRGSWLSWQVQTHTDLLHLATSLFLACALDSLHLAASEGHGWGGGKEREGVVRHSSTLMLHVMKMLNIFSHIIDQKDPEEKEKKKLIDRLPQMEALSPTRPRGGVGDLPPRSLSVPTKEWVGRVVGMQHYLKMHDSLRAAHTNYQVSISPGTEDRFLSLLAAVHSCLAAVLEVALAEEIGRMVEEIVKYVAVTIQVDAPGALLCLQQMLNALFGLNVASQQTHIYSPFLSSLLYNMEAPPIPTPTKSLIECLVKKPVSQMETFLESPAILTTPMAPENTADEHKRKKNRLWLFRTRKDAFLQPSNAVSSIKDYISHFEPLVLKALWLFSHTSSIVIQERALFMMVQLLHLKVRYELLDVKQTFLETVNRLVSLMEAGSVQGGAQLVPHLFQFLMMLASDSPKFVSIPQVIQKCDAVMASGHNVTTFAVPALEPLVIHLFVYASNPICSERDPQREVALNMLLRLIEHPHVVQLLLYVLDFYQGNALKWSDVSVQIYASLVASAGRLQLILDTPSSLSLLQQLLSAMTPSSINVKGLFMTLMKQPRLTSITGLVRWLALTVTLFRIMATMFPEETILTELQEVQVRAPTLECVGVVLGPLQWGDGQETPSERLARFLMEVVYLGVQSLGVVYSQPYPQRQQQEMLSLILMEILLLSQILVKGVYAKLSFTLKNLSLPDSLLQSIEGVSAICPLLTLHFTSLLQACKNKEVHVWTARLLENLHEPITLRKKLLRHSLLALLPSQCWGMESLLSLSALLQLCSSTDGLALVRDACADGQFSQCMLALLSSFPETGSLEECLRMLSLLAVLCSNRVAVARVITHSFLTHSEKAVRLIAAEVLLEQLTTSVSDEELTELSSIIKPYQQRCVNVWTKLQSMVRKGDQPLDVHPLDHPLSNVLVSFASNDLLLSLSKPWQLKVVQKVCTGPAPSPLISCRLLLVLDQADMDQIMSSNGFPITLLEECVVQSMQLTLSRKNSHRAVEDRGPLSISLTYKPESLLQVSVARLLALTHRLLHRLNGVTHLAGDEELEEKLWPLSRALVWLLVSRDELPLEIVITSQIAAAVNASALASLELASRGNSSSHCQTLRLQTALDLCTLVLNTSETGELVTGDWPVRAVTCLTRIVEHEYSTEFTTSNGEADEKRQGEAVLTKLTWILSKLISSSPTSHFLRQPLPRLAFSLARLPMFSPTIFLPPVIGTSVSTQLLDQALSEVEVLQEYMQRSNLIGWVSRNQFEERWMQLLGVINTPPPPEGMPMEETVAHTASLCEGVCAATALLISTMLRPTAGHSPCSVLMHTHRNKDINFLSSPAGKRLMSHRTIIEAQIQQHCGLRPMLHAHYQLPVMNDRLSSSHPPIFATNLERQMGSVALGPCQLSLNSLLPVTLNRDPHSSRTSPQADQVDTRSCILSLLDLYSHWLSKSISLPLLHHTLSSVILLSDQFVLLGQFEWMLATFMQLYERHPCEDGVIEPLLVFGILKMSAVLKVEGNEAEKVAKLVERSLSSDSFISSQNACLQGLLYVAENGGSTSVLLQVGPALAKYLLLHLGDADSYSEAHIMLVWSLTTQLVLMHPKAQLSRDSSFIRKVLDSAISLLSHSLTSTQLFSSLTTGLELMVLHFSLSYSERSHLTNVAASIYVKSDHGRSLSALALLLTCMYTGENADRVSGLPSQQEDMAELSESVYQSREHILNILERLRVGNQEEVHFMVDILPGLITDFLPPMDAMNTVVTEIISQQQTRPWLAAFVLNKTFELLLAMELDPTQTRKPSPTVEEWVLLSLDSFVQQEPEEHAVWCITCLLMAASTNPYLRGLYPMVAGQQYPQFELLLQLMCTAALHLCQQQNFPNEKKQFLDKFERSSYISLQRVAHCLKSR